MKKLIYYVAIITSIIFTSCKEDDEKPTEPDLKIDNLEIKLDNGDVGTKSFSFTANASWEISLSDTKAVPSWFTIDRFSGVASNSVTVNISIKEANPSTTQARLGYIKIVAGSMKATLIVTQPASETVAVTGVTLNKNSLSILIGIKKLLSAIIIPKNATNQKVIWSSNNNEVATVNETGEVTAVKIGEATIIATTVDGNKIATCVVTVKGKHIPDAGFRKHLKTLGFVEENDDIDPANAINKELFNKTTFLMVSDRQYNVSSMLGIGLFVNLEELLCSQQQLLTTIDLSKNTKLHRVNCSNNTSLTSINLSQNLALTWLQCDGNKLTKIDISNNIKLKLFSCIYNQLSGLDLSKNTALTRIYCYNNMLTALNLSTNTALLGLDCINNNLTTLDISKNSALILDSKYLQVAPQAALLMLTMTNVQKSAWDKRDWPGDKGYVKVVTIK